MEHVRPGKDVVVYAHRGEEWVQTATGGVSTFATLPRWGRNWWGLPAGTACSELLAVVNDHGDHWLWQPARNMELRRYRDALATLNAEFVRS